MQDMVQQGSINRRGFIAGAGALATGAVVAGAAAGVRANAAEAGASDDTTSQAFDQQTDLLVVGSGMGGLCAGLQALDDGVENVTVIEISRHTGGGTAFSIGAIHVYTAGTTDDSYDAFTEYVATDELSHEVFEGQVPLIRWLNDDMDLPVIDSTFGGDTPCGFMSDRDGNFGAGTPRAFFDLFVDKFQSMGGTLLTQTAARELITDEESGAVIGARCTDSDGNTFTIGAKAVILACGGFQGDPALRAQWLAGADHWPDMGVMGTPYNLGSGIKMATAVGASLQGNFNQWAGTVIPAQPAKHWLEDAEAYEKAEFTEEVGGIYWMYNSIIDTLDSRCIWVNNNGLRFVDENKTALSSKPAISLQPHATAHIICDSTVWNEWMETSATQGMGHICQDIMDVVTSDEVGGKIFQADTIEDLADQMNAAGPATYKVHKANLIKTINEYNEAAQAGTGADLYPPKAGEGDCVPIVTPPFYAVPVQPCPYATFGGVAIDTNAQVLDMNRRPIAGLYACFPTAGGVIHENYSGSINAAGVTGRIAGSSAAAAIKG